MEDEASDVTTESVVDEQADEGNPSL